MANIKGVLLVSLLVVSTILLTAFSLTAFDKGNEDKTVEILKGTLEESLPLVTANHTCAPDGGSGGGHACIPSGGGSGPERP